MSFLAWDPVNESEPEGHLMKESLCPEAAAEAYAQKSFFGGGDYFQYIEVRVKDLATGVVTDWEVEVEYEPIFRAAPGPDLKAVAS